MAMTTVTPAGRGGEMKIDTERALSLFWSAKQLLENLESTDQAKDRDTNRAYPDIEELKRAVDDFFKGVNHA